MTEGKETEAKIKVKCPHCQKQFYVPPKLIGKSGPCKNCGKIFEITQDIIVQEQTPSQINVPGQTAPTEKIGPPAARVAFRNEKRGYSFAMPTEGWYRADKQLEKDWDADMVIVHDDIGTIKIVYTPWKLSFEDLPEGVEEGYRQDLGDFHRIDRGETQVDGNKAGWLEFQSRDEETGEQVKFMSVFFLKGKIVYQLIGFTNPVFFSRLRKEMIFLGETFSFRAEEASHFAHLEKAETKVPSPTRSVRGDFDGLDAEAILLTGAKWGGIGAGIGLVVVILALALGWIGKSSLLWIFVIPLLFGITVANYRWGSIAGNIGGGLALIEQIDRRIAQIVTWPMRAFNWLMVFLVANVLQLSSRDARGMGRLTDFFLFLSIRINLFLSSLLACTLAGLPYAVYVAVTKRIRVDRWGFVGMTMVGTVIFLTVVAVVGAIHDSQISGRKEWKRQTIVEPPPTPPPTPPPPLVKVYPSNSIQVSASSQLPAQGANDYSPTNTVDGVMNTAWAEGTPGDGIGESITYTFSEEVDLKGINVVAGYNKSENIFFANNRLKRISLTFDGGKSVEENLRDSQGWQNINLGNGLRTRTVTLKILEVYAGSKFNDAAFSEIQFMHTPVKSSSTTSGPSSSSPGSPKMAMGQFLMPETSQRLISERELVGKSARELNLFRNEIYARHGRPFETDWIREYFESQPWYRVDPNFSNDRLSEIEQRNVQTILSYEKKMGYK